MGLGFFTASRGLNAGGIVVTVMSGNSIDEGDGVAWLGVLERDGDDGHNTVPRAMVQQEPTNNRRR